MIAPSKRITIAALMFALAPTHLPAQSPEAMLPGMKVLLENDCVRVRRHDFAVGQSVPMHSHPAYVGYPLNSFKALITLADGTRHVTQRKAGLAYWSPPVEHAVKNIGKTPIHALIVEIKPGGKCQ